jgi:Domain of unknown function (DUF4331)
MTPAVHCPHAGPSGGNVCGSVAFRTDAANTYTRVDRMGMPAVATALIAAEDKNAYNDDVDGSGGANAFLAKYGASLTAIHTALDADITSKTLTPCSMTTIVNGLPECIGQEYAPGKTVASLVNPYDALALDLTVAAGFPNGRMLADPVIDVTLAVLLLKMGAPFGAATQTAGTLAGLPLNPPKNDINGGVFGTAFPYFLPKQ